MTTMNALQVCDDWREELGFKLFQLMGAAAAPEPTDSTNEEM